MHVSLIAAMGRDRVIGRDNDMPWRVPADMRRFRQLTLGKPVVMGRRTFESIGRPLPRRRNLVLSRRPGLDLAGVEVIGELDEALARCRGEPEVMIAGGAQIYRLALPLADRMYLTYIDQAFPGDARFPPFVDSDWERVAEDHHPAGDDSPYDLRFVRLERRSGAPGRR